MQNFSILQMFWTAGVFAKIIMLTLLVLSILSWTLIINNFWRFSKSCRIVKNYTHPKALNNLAENYHILSRFNSELTGLNNIFMAGYQTAIYLQQKAEPHLDFIMQEAKNKMDSAIIEEQFNLENDLPTLATIQSISPYIGLLGTVWSIITTFHVMGNDYSLAKIAPLLSEALFATALGLLVAIPAGVAYNRLVAMCNNLLYRYENFSEELLQALKKQMIQEKNFPCTNTAKC